MYGRITTLKRVRILRRYCDSKKEIAIDRGISFKEKNKTIYPTQQGFGTTSTGYPFHLPLHNRV